MGYVIVRVGLSPTPTKRTKILPSLIISIFLIDIIPHLTDDGQIMGHFIAENDAGDAARKGFAGHGFGIHGFMMKVLTGNA
jgi:hypothetical protein